MPGKATDTKRGTMGGPERRPGARPALKPRAETRKNKPVIQPSQKPKAETQKTKGGPERRPALQPKAETRKNKPVIQPSQKSKAETQKTKVSGPNTTRETEIPKDGPAVIPTTTSKNETQINDSNILQFIYETMMAKQPARDKRKKNLQIIDPDNFQEILDLKRMQLYEKELPGLSQGKRTPKQQEEEYKQSLQRRYSSNDEKEEENNKRQLTEMFQLAEKIRNSRLKREALETEGKNHRVHVNVNRKPIQFNLKPYSGNMKKKGSRLG
jgi:hypothetical protein